MRRPARGDTTVYVTPKAVNTRPVSEAERLKVSRRKGSKEGEYHCQATLAQMREKTEMERPGERRTSRQDTSLSASVSSSRRSVTSVRQNTHISDSISENPPEAPKGRANPPTSYNNPPIVGPKREPTPLKDSANDVALPFTHQHVRLCTVYSPVPG